MGGSFPHRQSYFRETSTQARGPAKVGCVGVCFGDRTVLGKVKSERNVTCQHWPS